jgi:hypothetical protein
MKMGTVIELRSLENAPARLGRAAMIATTRARMLSREV